jgi:predicted transcriptional regulator YdeE
MWKVEIFLPEIKLVGITIRTNNQDELNYELGKIFPCVQRYFNLHVADSVADRARPGGTYCVYTEYSHNMHEYSFFMGEEVFSFDCLQDGLETLVIPAQHYAKFSVIGSMPDVVVDSWRAIWLMSDQELGGKRNYLADFEIYDARSFYDKDVAFDIYIGIDAPAGPKRHIK